jgi:hypothetical protein
MKLFFISMFAGIIALFAYERALPDIIRLKQLRDM